MNVFRHGRYRKHQGVAWHGPVDLRGLYHTVTWPPLGFHYRSIVLDPSPGLYSAFPSLYSLDKQHPLLGCKVTLNLQSKILTCCCKLPSIIQQGCLQVFHFPQPLSLVWDQSDNIITALVIGNYSKGCEEPRVWELPCLSDIRRPEENVTHIIHGIMEAWCKIKQTGFFICHTVNIGIRLYYMGL